MTTVRGAETTSELVGFVRQLEEACLETYGEDHEQTRLVRRYRKALEHNKVRTGSHPGASAGCPSRKSESR